MTTDGTVEEKVDLGEINIRLTEIFQAVYSLTPKQAKEQSELMGELSGLAQLERVLTGEEIKAMGRAYIRQANLSRIVATDMDEERLELTRVLLKIREREAREAKKEKELVPWEREAREAEKEEGVSPVVSGAESIGANRGVFNKAGAAWRNP